MRAGEPGVEGDGLLEVGERAVVIVRPEFESAPQQTGLGGVPLAEDAIDCGCAAGALAIADESGPIQVVERRFGRLLLLHGGQQRDGLRVLSEGVIATGEQQGDLVPELGREGGGPFKAGGSLGGTAGLVIGQPQIQQQGWIVGALREGAIIFRNGFVVAAGAGQRGAQVGTRLQRIRLGGQIFAVGPDGAVEVARLMQSDGVLEERIGLGGGLLGVYGGRYEGED